MADDAVEETRSIDTSAVAGLDPTETTTVDNVPYTRSLNVTSCWQPRAQTSGACGTVRTTGDAAFLRVTVTMSWPGPSCTHSVCTYTTSTLISNAAGEPYFDSDQSG